MWVHVPNGALGGPSSFVTSAAASAMEEGQAKAADAQAREALSGESWHRRGSSGGVR